MFIHSHLTNMLFMLLQFSFRVSLLFLQCFPRPSIPLLLLFFFVNVMFSTCLLYQMLSMGFATAVSLNTCRVVHKVSWHIPLLHRSLEVHILAALRQINRILQCQIPVRKKKLSDVNTKTLNSKLYQEKQLKTQRYKNSIFLYRVLLESQTLIWHTFSKIGCTQIYKIQINRSPTHVSFFLKVIYKFCFHINFN